jgi:16S rRNA (guanine527-N7)-methyltransferase
VSALRDAHQAALARFRDSMNLIGPGDLHEHFQDCERALSGLQPQGTWADLGSGAGFPGLVFADLWPHVPLHLVESRQKRAWFLNHVLAEARWTGPVTVQNQRVEDLVGPYDGLISRAFAPVPDVAELARRLLAPGGQLVLFLQDDAPDPALRGFVRLRTQPYRVAGKARRSEVWAREETPSRRPPPRTNAASGTVSS